MLGKAFDFLVSVVINGVLALFIAAFFYIIFAFLLVFAMFPVSIIAGDEAASRIIDFAIGDDSYRIIYAVVFISMMMDDLSIPNIKTALKRCWRWMKDR